jgi:uncharacterized membrane protein
MWVRTNFFALICMAAVTAAPAAFAQSEPERPRVIDVTNPPPQRPTMAPVADEEPAPKPKIIKVRPQPKKFAPPKGFAPAQTAAPVDPAAQNDAAPVQQGRNSQTPAAAPQPVTDAADPPSGQENYEYCNRTSFAINVAVGVRDGALWRTRGWWTIYPGDCKPIIKGKLMPTAYFTFARTHFVHQGPTRMWGGNHMLCVGRGQFQASSDGTGVCAPGLEAQGFAKIDTGSRPSWRTTLVEPGGLRTKEAARIAGLQRLLSDLSLYVGDADGVANAGYKQALADVRTKLGYPVEEDQTQTYVRLLAEAAKVQSQTGLTFCNRSPSALWVALGLDDGGRKQSRGWWRIQSGQCEKVIKDRLSQRYLFAHASNDKGGADGAWAGKFPFCTKDAVFEMEGGENCEPRGGERTGFFAIDTQGRPGAVYNFNPKNATSGQAQ